MQLAGEEGLVGAEVEVAVAREIEENGLPLAVPLAPQGLVDHHADRVRRLRRGNDALGARELDGGLERGDL